MAISEPTALDLRIHRRASLMLEVMQQLLTHQPPGLTFHQRAEWLLKSRAAMSVLAATAAQWQQTPPRPAALWLGSIQQTLTDAADSGLDDDEFQGRLVERLTEMIQRGNRNDTIESGATIEQSGSPPALPAPR